MEEAASYFRKVLQLNQNNIMARENLENLYSHLMDRWHFRMLNDHTRNSAYFTAIEKVIANGYNQILDIGAGTGLLR